jgi:hypothetical protein
MSLALYLSRVRSNDLLGRFAELERIAHVASLELLIRPIAMSGPSIRKDTATNIESRLELLNQIAVGVEKIASKLLKRQPLHALRAVPNVLPIPVLAEWNRVGVDTFALRREANKDRCIGYGTTHD